MRRLLGLLLIGFALLPAAVQAAASTGCFCYYVAENGIQYCSSSSVTINSAYCEADCAAFYNGTEAAPGDGINVPELATYTSTESQTTFESELCADNAEPAAAAASSSVVTAPTIAYATPQLNVEIPGLTDASFAKPLVVSGNVSSNFIGTYISGVYGYLVGAALTIAIVMMMIGGLQYVVGATSGQVEKAKTRIKNAVEGFVLLLFVAVILYTVNPNLTLFRNVETLKIDMVKLDMAASGDEGKASTCPGVSTLADMPEPYKSMIEDAQASGECTMTGTMRVASPTGNPPNCGKHHWFDDGAKGKWKDMKNLDYAAPWGEPILAPFDGTASYLAKGDVADNKCGNTITLKGSGASIFICHAKDFIGADGTFKQDRPVKQGEVMGHLGGNCCTGQIPPSHWSAFSTDPVNDPSWCNKPGPACTNPESNETCSCQTIAQAGNTSGPHVHITWSEGGDLLACLKTD